MRYRFLSLIVFLFSLICILLILEMSTNMVEITRAEPPSVINITLSTTVVRAGANPVYVQVNAEDAEDPEWNLTIEDIEWQYKDTSTWSSTWFGDKGYDATGGGYIWVEFEPPSTATPGYYGFRVKVNDTDGNISEPWVEIMDAVYVGGDLDIIYVTPETDSIYRGEQLTVRMSGEDAIDSEDELIPHLECRKKGASTWTEVTGSPSYNHAGGYWEVYWVPDITQDLGHYEFQGRFENTENAFSDYEDGSLDVTVMNNVPTAIGIGIVGSVTSVDRDDSITLYANGHDEETAENKLIAYFEYSAPGDTWDNAYLSGKTYNDADNRWEIDFEPENDAELGDYSFRVYFRDNDGDESNPAEMSDTIEVNNVRPVVEDLTVPFTAFRGEPITLTANGWDADGIEGLLTPTFEWRSPSGSWTPVPGSANYVGTSFRITWIPGANEDVGDYGFRVSFSDGDDDSDWGEDTTTFTLENNPPDVNIIPPQRDGTDVAFSAIGFDEEDTNFDLVYEWDFGDGSTSTDPITTHEYTQSGTYDVAVTVTDSDGDTATDNVLITIPSDEFPSSGPPEPLRFLLLIIFIITVIMTVFFAFVVFKRQGEKRKGEGVQ